MSPLRTAATPKNTDLVTARPSASPSRRRRILVVLAVLVAALVVVPVAADAAASAMGAHEHGTLDITIDGDTVDLDQSRFHELHPHVHVHEGHGNTWHHHPENITGILTFEAMTLSEALAAIGADLTDDALTFDGTVHRAADPARGVTVRVNGTDVDPDSHVIGDGDAITVEVATGR